MRDNFTKKVAETLGKRAGFHCSKPDCGVFCVGPQKAMNAGSVNMGRAAHITAASAGGPRHDSRLSPKERKDISNGIWLCANHADLVDKDERAYSVELLNEWKRQAEVRAGQQIGKTKVAKEDSHRRRALQIRREHKLRDALKREILRPFDPRATGRDAKCYNRFNGKLVIHSLEDKTYPKYFPSSSWFTIEPYDFYPTGLELIALFAPGVLDDAGNWKLINPDREKPDPRFRSVRIFVIGKLPWRNVHHCDFASDGYFSGPHLYCAFTSEGSPYEGVEYRLDGGEYYDPVLDPAKEIPVSLSEWRAVARPVAPGVQEPGSAEAQRETPVRAPRGRRERT
jgi:hypothetical protein